MKKFLKGHGFLQHFACFLLYVFSVTGALLLWELLEDWETLSVLSATLVLVPLICWIFYLGYCDVTALGRWIWKHIVPEKRRKEMTASPKTMAVKKPAVSEGETEIFRMWDDAVVWKDGQLQLRKNGKYTPITVEQAREQEYGYHRYQMSMDVNRGGLPDEVAQKNRGFDSDGNYVRPYEVDSFLRKKFDIETGSSAEPVKSKCRGCGTLIAPSEMTVRDGSAYCERCVRQLKIKAVRCERCGTTLKLGAPVLRGGKSYCKYCGSLPDVNNDRMVYETGVWSIVWNDGELYVRSRESGCRRIGFLQAKTIESDHARRMMEKAVRFEGWSPEEAERAWGFENGKFVKKYAMDEFLEGMKSKKIADAVYGSVVWMENGLHYLKSDGSCKPITIEEARQLEKNYWSYDADHIYRMGAPMEQVQKTTGFDENGNQLRPYAVDEFMKARMQVKCARCGESVNRDEVTVREGSAYCADCARRLKIKQKKVDEAKKQEVLEKVKSEIRCEHCGKLLKAGEVVSRRGAPYCRKCGDMPKKLMKETVLHTGGWSIVWKNGNLYKHTQKDGYVRINLQKARKMEREYWWGHVYIAVDRFSLTQAEAEEKYGFKDGQYVGSYAVDALKDGRKGTEIFSTILDSVIWMDGGLYLLKYSGEYSPISVEDARKMELDHWNDRAAWAYRASDVECYEEYQSRIDKVNRGEKQYSVDEFMERPAEAVCTRCGAKHHAPLKDLAAPDFACKTCGNPVKITVGKAPEEAKKKSKTLIICDGLVYCPEGEGVILHKVKSGAKEAVVYASVEGKPLTGIGGGAFENCDPELKLTFEPGFRVAFKLEKHGSYVPLPPLPGFSCETVREIAHCYNPDIRVEKVHRSEIQTLREIFDYHGFAALHTLELE